MKVRESGMPEERVWQTFFHVDELLTKMGLTSSCNDVVEFGCGYGTFTIPAAQRVRGKVMARMTSDTISTAFLSALSTRTPVIGL